MRGGDKVKRAEVGGQGIKKGRFLKRVPYEVEAPEGKEEDTVEKEPLKCVAYPPSQALPLLGSFALPYSQALA